MKSSQIVAFLATFLGCALISSAQLPIFLGNGLVQTGLGLGAQIGGGLATLGAAALVAQKWKAENTQPVLFKQPVIQKNYPVPVTAVQAVKTTELGDLTGGLSGLSAALGAIKPGSMGLSFGGGDSLSKSLNLQLNAGLRSGGHGRRRRSAEDYYQADQNEQQYFILI